MRTAGLCVLALTISIATVFAQSAGKKSALAVDPNSALTPDPTAVEAESQFDKRLIDVESDPVQVRVGQDGNLVISSEDPESLKRLEDVLKLLQQGRLEEARIAQRKATQAVAQATAQAKKGSRADLERLVREDFAFRQQTQLAEIRLLKQRLESLERRVQQQEKLSEELIQQRIRSLLSTPSSQADPYRKSGTGGQPNRIAETMSRRSLAGQPPANYKVRAGDTLGVFIPNILGKADESPPIHKDPTGRRPPALGYPIAVRADGSISLPHVGEIKVVTKSLAEIEKYLRDVFEGEGLLKLEATIIVSLIRKVDDRVETVSLPATTSSPFTRMEQESARTTPRMRPASEYVEQFADLQAQIDALQNKIPGDSTREAHFKRLDSYKLQYAALQRELEYQLSAIQSALKSAHVERELAQSDYAHAETLAKKGFKSSLEVKAAKASVTKANARLEQFERLYALFKEVVPSKTATGKESGATYARTTKKRIELALPERVVEISLKQRQEKPIPGSDSRLWVHLGDVTAGQAFVSVRTGDRNRYGDTDVVVLLDEVSLDETEIASFKVNGTRFYVRMKDLRNVLIGEDFGTVEIAADRADFKPLKKLDEEKGPADRRESGEEKGEIGGETEGATEAEPEVELRTRTKSRR